MKGIYQKDSPPIAPSYIDEFCEMIREMEHSERHQLINFIIKRFDDDLSRSIESIKTHIEGQ